MGHSLSMDTTFLCGRSQSESVVVRNVSGNYSSPTGCSAFGWTSQVQCLIYNNESHPSRSQGWVSDERGPMCSLAYSPTMVWIAEGGPPTRGYPWVESVYRISRPLESSTMLCTNSVPNCSFLRKNLLMRRKLRRHCLPRFSHIWSFNNNTIKGVSLFILS